MAWEPDRRSNFFSPPPHLCAVTYMTEISLIVTLNNQFTLPYQAWFRWQWHYVVQTRKFQREAMSSPILRTSTWSRCAILVEANTNLQKSSATSVRPHSTKPLHSNYTTAGMQKRQIDSKCYEVITWDEGHKFLSSISPKRSTGESEKAFLCKLWGDRGDGNVLANDIRSEIRGEGSNNVVSTCAQSYFFIIERKYV